MTIEKLQQRIESVKQMVEIIKDLQREIRELREALNGTSGATSGAKALDKLAAEADAAGLYDSDYSGTKKNAL